MSPFRFPPSGKFPFCAFSLIEVTLSIGILSFALTLILGLLPIGIQSSRASVHEKEALILLERLDQDIRNARGTADKSPLYKLSLPTPGTGPEVLFFDSNFEAVTATDTNRLFRVESRITPTPEGREVHLLASWPALASRVNAKGSGEIVTFVFNH